MNRNDCSNCNFYDKLSGLCGACIVRILEEVKNMQEVKRDGSRQDNAESDEQTV